MFLFSLAWTGWSYLFYISFATSILYIILCKIKKIEIKTFLEVLLLFFAISIVLIVLYGGINGYYCFNLLSS